MLEKYNIIKKNGSLEKYNPQKIEVAIQKSAQRVEGRKFLTEEEVFSVIKKVEEMIIADGREHIPVESIHSFVIVSLNTIRNDVGAQYSQYHFVQKGLAQMFTNITEQMSNLLYRGDLSNANVDNSMCSSLASTSSGYLNTELFKKQFLTFNEMEAINEGYIKVHDMDKRIIYKLNCCLFDVSTLLKDGFEMGNIWYNEPKTLDVAFDVIGDIVLSAASQQYGGFTVPEVDKILAVYAEKSYERYVAKYISMGIEKEMAEKYAYTDVENEYKQGFQGWEYKFNTVASSRGDYPFITVTTGIGKSKFEKLATLSLLAVRKEGQGKKGFKRPVLFPKIVFLYDKNLHDTGKELEDLFEAGIECSAKAMYPDWLSLTGEGYVPSMYKKYGAVISPMGCRAFLSPWYEKGGMTPLNDKDKPVFVGRFNIGVVSLNLPMILAKSRRESKDFFELLDYYLQMCREIHIRTKAEFGEQPASRNPLAFVQGGLYGGHLRPEQKIKENPEILNSATASFGFTALNELQRLYNGKSIREDGEYALEVIKYINEKIEQFKKEDGILYAMYGTPAESLCGLQVKQFRAKYGIIEGVSDREYVSNSFHCHVTEDISPIEKQDLEGRFWDYSNGGKIQYVKYPNSYNTVAIKTLVKRAMTKGYYEGVNLSLSYCTKCGNQSQDIEYKDKCQNCGSDELCKIDRMNGYLAYSRVHGKTRLNKAKMAEIEDRLSM